MPSFVEHDHFRCDTCSWQTPHKLTSLYLMTCTWCGLTFTISFHIAHRHTVLQRWISFSECWESAAGICSVPVSFATPLKWINPIIVNDSRQDESNAWGIKPKTCKYSGSCSRSRNSQIAQQQPGKECCSETLELSAKASKRKHTHCCKKYFLINVI